jgi:hypothetical protein
MGPNEMINRVQDFNFDQPTTGVSVDRLDAFEDELGQRLDDNYRDFLRSMNGGRPDPALISSIQFLPYPVLMFLGLDDGKSNVLGAYKDLSQAIGRLDLVPIAFDTSFGRICLKTGLSPSPVVVVTIDDLYGREPTSVVDVCDSFLEFWNSLSQPQKLIPKLEELAERSWREIEMFVTSNPEYLGSSNNGELSLLCQAIRAENDEAFFGLVGKGACLDSALRIAVSCERLDYVEKLVELGSPVADGIPYAVGPSRRKIREYLQQRSQ